MIHISYTTIYNFIFSPEHLHKAEESVLLRVEEKSHGLT